MITGSIITNSLALLAFVVAFYTLIAREKKTPYITNYIFPPAVLLFVTILLVLLQQLIHAWRQGLPELLSPTSPTSTATQTSSSLQPSTTELALLIFTNILFYFGAVWIVRNIWRLHNRQVHFRDDNEWKNIRLVRRIRHFYRRIAQKPSYENNPETIDSAVLSKWLADCGFHSPSVPESNALTTLAMCGYSIRDSDKVIVRLAASALSHDWQVQYSTCARHPYEWVSFLKKELGDKWNKYVQHIAVVDGYTPHFGFTDSIHAVRTSEVLQEGVSYVATPESFAGVHTAISKAFNLLKQRSTSPTVRKKTLLFYEGCRSLVDLESVEQYRLFLRHVLTSERMWGGMVTVIVEPETDEASLNLIRAYCDVIDIRKQEVVIAND
jgi:hypothetical protein